MLKVKAGADVFCIIRSYLSTMVRQGHCECLGDAAALRLPMADRPHTPTAGHAQSHCMPTCGGESHPRLSASGRARGLEPIWVPE